MLCLSDFFSFFYYSFRFFFFFFFNDTATTEIYTLSLHDALPISSRCSTCLCSDMRSPRSPDRRDRKSTRLNSSHVAISYAVFCLKKKKKQNHIIIRKMKKNTQLLQQIKSLHL